jgi:hypothetical protein
MFRCVECKHEGPTFCIELSGLDSGSLTYKAKCPQCGGQLVNVVGTVKTQDLRITEAEYLKGS